MMKVVYDTDAYLKKHNKNMPLPSVNNDSDPVKSSEQSSQQVIAEDRTERLLKLAETDPELAGKIADFIKADTDNSKPDCKKIEITPEQKMYAKKLLWTQIWGTGLFFGCIILGILTGSANREFPIGIFLFGFLVAIVSVILSINFSLKAGIPTFKSLASKYFKW